MSINDNDIASMYPAMMQVMSQHKPTSPWQYVKNWSWSDKGPYDSLADLNKRMQNRWPGKYKIVNEPRWNGRDTWIDDHKFVFDSPRDETWFILQWSK